MVIRAFLIAAAIGLNLVPATSSLAQVVDTFDRHLWVSEEPDYQWGKFPAEKLQALLNVQRRFVGTGGNAECFDVKVTGDITARVDGALQQSLMVIDYVPKARYLHGVREDGSQTIPSDDYTRDLCGRSWTFFVDESGVIVRDYPGR